VRPCLEKKKKNHKKEWGVAQPVDLEFKLQYQKKKSPSSPFCLAGRGNLWSKGSSVREAQSSASLATVMGAGHCSLEAEVF
jgi:hypothetical protein